MTNIWREKLLSIQVISKNDNESSYFDSLTQNVLDFENFKEMDEIMKMISDLGINLDSKNTELFKNSNDLYFRKYKQKADRLRAYMDRVIKEIFKKKWNEKKQELKKEASPKSGKRNEQEDQKNVFITNLPDKRRAKYSLFSSSSSNLQSKVKKKLEKLINSTSIFPFLPNFSEPVPKLSNNNPPKLNKSKTLEIIKSATLLKNDINPFSDSHKKMENKKLSLKMMESSISNNLAKKKRCFIKNY